MKQLGTGIHTLSLPFLKKIRWEKPELPEANANDKTVNET